MDSTSFTCVIGLIMLTSTHLIDSRTCPETFFLSSLKDTRLSVYQEMATFPCGGHMIGWRAVGIIPIHSLHIGVWIPNHGSQKLLTHLEPMNKVSNDNMEPLIIESGDFYGLVLLNDSSLSLSKFARLPSEAATVENSYLVAVVPRDTKRGSVVHFKEISFLLIPAEFTLSVQIDYSGNSKAKRDSSKKLNKRDKSTKCSQNLPNCETCSKIKGELVCSLCKEGFFGRTCKDNCPESCAACDQSNGDCTRCAAGYFGTNCKELCPSGCSPFLGCNADSGCTQCQLGWEGKWCKEFISSCNEGRFHGSNCKEQCPERCESCNTTPYDKNCLFCKQGIQWKLCRDNMQSDKAGSSAEEGSDTLGAVLGAIFAVLILIAVGGIAFYLIRRKRRDSLIRRETEMTAQNGLPSREALEERSSNLYVKELLTATNQNRTLPPPPPPQDEDEEGYMAPHAKPDVTSRLLREEEQTKDEKSSKHATDKSSPPQEDMYEAIGDVEPIEETFE